MYEVLDINSKFYIYTDILYEDSLGLSDLNYKLRHTPKDKFITEIIIPEGLTKPSSGDMIDVVEFNGKLIMFNSVNPVSKNDNESANSLFSQNMNNEETSSEINYKNTTVNGEYINAFAYITYEQFFNDTQTKPKIFILKGYVPPSDDRTTVKYKPEHPIVVMKNFDWWLQKIETSFKKDTILEVKVGAKIDKFDYNGQYLPSFWLNPSQKTFSYKFLAAPTEKQTPFVEEENNTSSLLDEFVERSFKDVNSPSAIPNQETTSRFNTPTVSLEEFVDNTIKERLIILQSLITNPNYETYFKTLKNGDGESPLDSLIQQQLITSILIEYNRTK